MKTTRIKSKSVTESKLKLLKNLIRENILDIMTEAEAAEDPKLTDLKKKIKGLKNIINNPSFPADKKDSIKKTIQKLEASLTDAVLASTSGEAAKAKGAAKQDIKSESIINEDVTIFSAAISAVLGIAAGIGVVNLLGVLGIVGVAKLSNLIDIWKSYKDDKNMKAIVDRLKNDSEVQAYIKNTNKPGWQKMLATKLKPEEVKYLKQIYKTKFSQTESINEGTPEYKVGQVVDDINGDEPFKIVKIYPNKAAAMMDMKKTISPKLYKDLVDEVKEMYSNYRPINSSDDYSPWYILKPTERAEDKGYPPYLNPEAYVFLP